MIRAGAPKYQAGQSARYSSGGVNVTALGVVFAIHALLIALVLTYRFTIAEMKRPPAMIVQTLDLEPPSSPPDRLETPPEAAPVYVPRPALAIPLPQQAMLTTTTEVVPERSAPVNLPAVAAATPVAAPAPPAPQPVAGGDLSSTMLEGAPPRYPVESRRKREQGTVVLLLLVGTDGRVAEIRVTRSSGHARLDEAALKAVRRWRWSPAMRNGAAVEVRGTVEIPFILRDASRTVGPTGAEYRILLS